MFVAKQASRVKEYDPFFAKVGLGQTITTLDIPEGRLITEIGWLLYARLSLSSYVLYLKYKNPKF